jgi:predicted XRE-type DNA-binding protein
MTRKGYEVGGRNVFEDIEAPNAEEHLVKATLVFKIDTILKHRGLNQTDAAELFGVRQPDISKMLRGEFRQFSVERLLREECAVALRAVAPMGVSFDGDSIPIHQCVGKSV